MNREEVIQRLLKIEQQNKNHYINETVLAAARILMFTDQQYPEWMGFGPHYVVATEEDNDPEIYTTNKYGQPVLKHPWLHPSKGIIHEHDIGSATSLEGAQQRAEILKGKYGRRAIFRLVLVEELP